MQSYGNVVLILGGACLVLVVIAIVRTDQRRAGERRRVQEERRLHEARYQRVNTVYDAAVGSDAGLRRHFTAADVNLQNSDGDSALHMAYYAGQAEAIARLTAFGADETLQNREGLTPAEMAELAETERLLEQTLACMSGCVWLNEKQGRPLYQKLTKCRQRLYEPALVRVFLRAPRQRKVVCLAVKVGMPASERRLAMMLDGYGTKEIATNFLNSGSAELAAAATRWAARHGYMIQYKVSDAGARWGEF